MTISELMQKVRAEGLDMPMLYDERKHENAVVLEYVDDVWKVYISDERAGAFESTLQTFDNESDALVHVLLKLRQNKKARQSLDLLLRKKRTPSPPTHARQINGKHREAFLDDTRPYPEKIRFTLNQMDGSSFWSFSLWRAPEGTDFSKDIPDPEAYMKCTGSAEAMMIEVRHLDPDDSTVAYRMVVGKPGDYEGEPNKLLSWDDNHQVTEVFSGELFTADEAAAILYGYFEATSVAKFYRFRPTGVTKGIGTDPDSHDVSNADIKRQILNRAIIAYLGKGKSSFPRHDEAAVRELVAEVEADELLAKVKEIITGSLSVEIDWSTHTLSEAADEVARVMNARYPELGNEALGALRWQFSYNNK